MSQRFIGAHVSAAGGIENAPERADDIGANCLMLFSSSPRVWQKKKLSSQHFDQFAENREKFGIGPVITHALYLANLASDKKDLVEKSFQAIKYELEFDADIKGNGVVLHTGSHQGRGWDSAKKNVLNQIVKLLKETPVESTLLLENAASHNGKVGNKLEEIKWLLNGAEQAGKFVSQGRLGWCLDTCHAHAAGYWLGKVDRSEGQADMFDEDSDDERVQPQSLEKAIDKLKLWNSLKCIHVNDSKDPFGSGRDRHQNLGDGEIPQEDFKYFLNLEQLQDTPLILEVPGIEGGGPDAENIRRLKKLVGEKA